MEEYTKDAHIFVKEHHDNCSVCGRHFQNNESTHIGYDSNRELVYVGDCCKKQIDSLIANHPYCPRVYEVPDNNSTLWRFMDLPKFLSLIQTQKLFFSRIDLMEDPYECAIGEKFREPIWDKYYFDFFSYAVNSVPGHENELSEDNVKEEAARLLKDLKASSTQKKQHTYIVCWHENKCESEAMWKLYTNCQQGIAIKTTYLRLYQALSRNPSIDIGRINYIDYSKRFAAIDSYWYKRLSFEHEHEVRAVIRSFDNSCPGMMIDVNIETLIEEIYISPYSGKWFKDVVKDLLVRYNINAPLKYSNMNNAAFY